MIGPEDSRISRLEGEVAILRAALSSLLDDLTEDWTLPGGIRDVAARHAIGSTR